MKQTKPRAKDGTARIEEIRMTLKMSMAEFSIALGFCSVTAVDMAVRRDVVTEQLLLAAEGLLHRHNKKIKSKSVQLLISIDADGSAKSQIIGSSDGATTAEIGGKHYLMVPLEGTLYKGEVR